MSRAALIDSKFSTVICAPVYTARHGLATEVEVGVDEGLKHESSIVCDALVSVPKSALTNYVSTLGPDKVRALNDALAVALGLE